MVVSAIGRFLMREWLLRQRLWYYILTNTGNKSRFHGGGMETPKRSITLTIGWVLLVILGALLTLGGLGSFGVAYFEGEEFVGTTPVEELAKVSPELPTAVRGRRATAAAFAFSSGVMLCWIAATAYRRREKWAWYALITSLGLGTALSILRISMIGITAGASTAGIILGVLLVALLISYRDF
jgi:hypothetical protein